MITKEQLLNGLLRYIDDEIIPNLPSTAKCLAGTWITLISFKYDYFFEEIINNKLIKPLGITNEQGLIDEELVLRVLKQNTEKYGPLQFNVPVMGTFSFSASDIDKLKLYIRGGVNNDVGGINDRINQCSY